MNTHLRNTIRRGSALLGLWVAVVAVQAAPAQSATVTVNVHLPGGAKKSGLRVRAVPELVDATSTTWKLDNFDHTLQAYTYTFPSLRPGRYAFVVCDGLEYVPGLERRPVTRGSNDPVDIYLEAPKGERKEYVEQLPPGPDGQPVGKDEPVFLKDSATGCTLKDGKTERGGIAKFQNVPVARKYDEDSAEADRDP
jgi:hypothetical protein